MPTDNFHHVDAWVFDLDNTLYPPSARLFDQIEVKMVAYLMRELSLTKTEADQMRADYWARYGTTLAGLMAEQNMEPWPFLMDVHDISMADLDPDPDLASAIAALPGRRIVYTNGDTIYADKVLFSRGLSGVFDAIYGVEHADFHPKPERAAFEMIFAKDGITPASAAMFEDDIRNLTEPYKMGMQTIHVAPTPNPQPFIRHHTDNLAGFLTAVTQALPPDTAP